MADSDAAAWRWLSAEPNGVLAMLVALQPHDSVALDDEKTPAPSELPLAIRSVVLVMELALVSGGAFLLLLTSSVAGTLVRSLLHAVSDDEMVLEDAVVQTCEAVVFGWGLVSLMNWFFRRPKRDLVRRLSRFGLDGVKTCILSVLLHSIATIGIVFSQESSGDQVLVSWQNLQSAVRRPDGSLFTEELMQNLLFAPMKEELLFRGLNVLVTINRLRSIKCSAFISSLAFTAIHLVNFRRLGTRYSSSYLAFQLLWASLVGMFLALKFALSGSLIECFVLHTINNVFALSVSKTVFVVLTQPRICCTVFAALSVYAVAIFRQLQTSGRTTISAKQR
ncbi:unnamed protein product [Phytophthora lilii]|uniref:Unnamed protein product n=1 Tax=Phytophthora lilii TaxID=2077276 RepID=A0A9W6WVH1_9STRA|nr:unnamed protein product [Phytophthora lilii]